MSRGMQPLGAPRASPHESPLPPLPLPMPVLACMPGSPSPRRSSPCGGHRDHLRVLELDHHVARGVVKVRLRVGLLRLRCPCAPGPAKAPVVLATAPPTPESAPTGKVPPKAAPPLLLLEATPRAVSPSAPLLPSAEPLPLVTLPVAARLGPKRFPVEAALLHTSAADAEAASAAAETAPAPAPGGPRLLGTLLYEVV